MRAVDDRADLPLVSVPMQAMCVPGRIHALRSKGSKAEVMVMIASASAQSASRSTASKGRPISSATA